MTGKKLVAACLAAAFLTITLSGCFVSESKFNAQTKELKTAQDSLAKVEGERNKAAADLAAAKQSAAKLQTDLTAAKTACKKAQGACGLAEEKVKTLETENASLKKQAGDAAKLQRDLTASKAAAKKSGDACKAAETEIKSLKGEIVKLNKKIADLQAEVKILSEKPAKTPPEAPRN